MAHRRGQLRHWLPSSHATADSAVARAQMAAAHYAQADLFGHAAALANGIALNHAFVDGNKRSALAACVTFLRVNGRPLAANAHLELAKQLVALHETTDRSQADMLLADWLRARAERQ